MRLLKLLKVMGVITVLSLVYINMQMNIIDLAYQEEDHKHLVRELMEDNSNINYKILTLKSAKNIGVKMLSEDSELKFGDSESVVRLASPDIEEAPNPDIKSQTNKTSSMLSLLSQ